MLYNWIVTLVYFGKRDWQDWGWSGVHRELGEVNLYYPYRERELVVMHRLASRAFHGHKGFTGISISGKPIASMSEVFLSRHTNFKSILYGKLATVTQISLIADGGHLQKIVNAVLSFPCIVPGSVSGPIITYPGERISN